MDVLHESDDKVPRPNKRIDDVNPRIRQRPVKFSFQDVFNTFHHEINNRLRRIDDAVRVGDLHRKTLKKLLIDSIEEVLFLGEVFAERGSVLNSRIERVQRFKKFVSTKGVLDEHLNDVLNLACDDIPAGEVRIIKDRPKNAFRQQMLDQHLLNRSCREVRIDRSPTLFVKVRKRRHKPRVRLVLFGYQFRESPPQRGHHLLEFCDSRVPIFKRSRRRGEEVLECRDQAGRLGDIHIKNPFPVLIEDTALRSLEEDIVKRIACVPFLLDGSLEIVIHILRFPIGEGEPISVEYHTVNDNTVAFLSTHSVLRNECRIRLFRTRIQQKGEGITDRTFVSDVMLVILLQRSVVVSDNFMSRFEIQLRHVGYNSKLRGIRQAEFSSSILKFGQFAAHAS